MPPRSRPIRILMMEDEALLRESLTDLLTDAGYHVRAEKDGRAGLNAWREERFDLILLDLVMPGVDGMAVLEEIRAGDTGIPVIIMTAHGTVETAVEAMKLGSNEFLTKPFRTEDLVKRLERYEDLIRLREENFVLRQERVDHPIVGESRQIRELLGQIEIVATNHATILITGESGTGKELVARAIHDQSEHGSGPFVKVSCPSLPETLLEAELFGHEKGAFTGAHQRKIGRFELAHEGTIFLDEIGDISPVVQVKLLRVLQEHAFERVGGTTTIEPHTRVVCATRFDLKTMVDEGRFREDLYYRLNVVTLEAPALRDRPEDIPLLVEHFMRKASFNQGKQVAEIAPTCVRLLKAYGWPGNVRQLENTIERAVMFCRTKKIGIADLPPDLRQYREELKGSCPDELDIHCHVRETERMIIGKALGRTGGNRTRAADLLGISRKRLWEKIKELNVLVD
ncbi:MAG: sigma-54 dependent transcriptional regulator [Planctomycetota bacterium]